MFDVFAFHGALRGLCGLDHARTGQTDKTCVKLTCLYQVRVSSQNTNTSVSRLVYTRLSVSQMSQLTYTHTGASHTRCWFCDDASHNKPTKSTIKEVLLAPCHCDAVVHMACLKQYMHSTAFLKCMICGHQYDTEHVSEFGQAVEREKACSLNAASAPCTRRCAPFLQLTEEALLTVLSFLPPDVMPVAARTSESLACSMKRAWSIHLKGISGLCQACCIPEHKRCTWPFLAKRVKLLECIHVRATVEKTFNPSVTFDVALLDVARLMQITNAWVVTFVDDSQVSYSDAYGFATQTSHRKECGFQSRSMHPDCIRQNQPDLDSSASGVFEFVDTAVSFIQPDSVRVTHFIAPNFAQHC